MSQSQEPRADPPDASKPPAVEEESTADPPVASKPPAMEQAMPKSPRADPEGPLVWLMAWGTRGDVLPFVGTSIALRDAGFRVMVWTLGAFVPWFAGHDGIRALAVDANLLHHCEPTASFFLLKASTDAEFSGITDLDDIFLYVMWMKVEVLTWKAMSCWKQDKLQDLGTTVVHLENVLNSMALDRFDYAAAWKSFRLLLEDYARGESMRLKMEIPALKELRNARRHEMIKTFKERAAKVGVMPLDVVDTFHIYMKGYMAQMMGQSLAAGVPAKHQVSKNFEDCFAWVKETTYEKFLEMQLEKLPHTHSLSESDILTHRTQTGSVLYCRNVMLELDNQDKKDWPKLVLGTSYARVLAHTVGERVGCRAMPIGLEMQPITSDHLYSAWQFAWGKEAEMPLESFPYRERGPLAVLDELRDPVRHIACWPPTIVQDFLFPKELKDRIVKFKEKALGPVLLHPARQLRCEGHGTVAAREEVEAFLAKGDAPVCFCWGATAIASVKRLFEACIGALRLSGKRGIILSRYTKMHPDVVQQLSPDDKTYFQEKVIFQRAVPHGWLFPQCCLVVSHGGRGTFYEVLRAGIPMLLVAEKDEGLKASFLAAVRSHASVHSHKQQVERLTPEILSKAIEEVLSKDKFKEAAAELREEYRKWPGEEGLARAVRTAMQAAPSTEEDEKTSQPWVDGDYDIIMADGHVAGKVNVHLGVGRGEGNTEVCMWFMAGEFKRIPPKNVSQPWLPAPTTEEVYHVEVLGNDGKVWYATVSPDGQTWNFSTGMRFVFRQPAAKPKACDCIIS